MKETLQLDKQMFVSCQFLFLSASRPMGGVTASVPRHY